MNYGEKSLEMHKKWQGKIEITPRVAVTDKEALSLAYTPGVAAACLAIEKDEDKSYTLTRRRNMCLVVTDGTAVLGLGDIGPLAAMPVMEGKCLLFKEFAGVDAFPLCINSKDVNDIVNTVYLISGSFGGVNLEDISAPRCFEIERKLKEKCDIPIFHDDQHGTAIVTLAGVINALKVVGKSLDSAAIVINGAGAAGSAIGRLLINAGAGDVVFCDKVGILCRDDGALPAHHRELAAISNKSGKSGRLKDAMAGADIFIGVSAPDIVSVEMVKSMAPSPIVFACANPSPEISPEDAEKGGAAVIATGRSDYPNQINNLLAFPGVFKGAFSAGAKDINEGMKIAAAGAIAGLINEAELAPDYIIPSPFDKRVVEAVASAVAGAARDSGVAVL